MSPLLDDEDPEPEIDFDVGEFEPDAESTEGGWPPPVMRRNY